MVIGRLHVLTDVRFQQRYSHARLAELAIAGGADTIQFRQKSGSLRDRLEALAETASVCRRAGVPLIVDDHLDLALAVEADGVHLGQGDLPVSVARRILGDEKTIGATASTAAEARSAQEDGASYIGFGPVYPTESKDNPQPVRGVDGLAAACAAVSIPVIAIAGITAERIPEVLAAGAHGVAVITAVSTAPDVTAAAEGLRSAIVRFHERGR